MLDRTGKRRRWTRALAAESRYSQKLSSLAKTVGTIVRGIAPNGELGRAPELFKALVEYGRLIEPWAENVAEVMVAEVFRRDKAMWKQNAKDLSRGIAREIEMAPTGNIFRALQQEQVKLITSLPLDAADRVHKIAQEGIVTSARASELQKQILETGEVTTSRARLIARTETSRAASNFVQARAMYVGSEGYIWRTSGDFDVRPSHQKMEGKFVRWSNPPTLDNLTGHAGCLPNCRCFAEPIFPDEWFND